MFKIDSDERKAVDVICNIKKNMKKNNIESQILVIFGSNGDLSKRKLLPAVFQLYIDNLLPENFVVVGAGSQEKDEVAYRVDVRESLSIFSKKTIAEYPEKLEEFLLKVYYNLLSKWTESIR